MIKECSKNKRYNKVFFFIQIKYIFIFFWPFVSILQSVCSRDKDKKEYETLD